LVVSGDEEECDGYKTQLVEYVDDPALPLGESEDSRDESSGYGYDCVDIPRALSKACPGEANDANHNVGNIYKGQAKEHVVYQS
jgi:hypothetical protein